MIRVMLDKEYQPGKLSRYEVTLQKQLGRAASGTSIGFRTSAGDEPRTSQECRTMAESALLAPNQIRQRVQTRGAKAGPDNVYRDGARC